MTAKQLREKIRFYLVRYEIDEAIDLLFISLNNNRYRRFYDNAIMLKAKWESVKQEQIKGILTRQEYDISVNKIIDGIQTIINEVDKTPIEHISDKNKKANVLKIVILAFILITALTGGYYSFNYLMQNSIADSAPGGSLKERTSSNIIETDKRMGQARQKVENNKKDSLLKKPLPSDIESVDSKKSLDSTPVDNKPESKPVFIDVKVIVANSNVALKIDSKTPEYIGTYSGIVRTIRIAEGKFKFEVIENGISCIVVRDINPTTKKIYLTCK